jgi:signal transduction histidine kinase
MFAAVGRLLGQVASPAGTLVLLDDLQWAGEDALDLFERFYRVDRARTRSAVQEPNSSLDPSAAGAVERERPPSSSGLGLSIAQWIAQAHRGHIQVHSTVGSGTTFEVWLPADVQEPPPHVPKES